MPSYLNDALNCPPAYIVSFKKFLLKSVSQNGDYITKYLKHDSVSLRATTVTTFFREQGELDFCNLKTHN